MFQVNLGAINTGHSEEPGGGTGPGSGTSSPYHNRMTTPYQGGMFPSSGPYNPGGPYTPTPPTPGVVFPPTMPPPLPLPPSPAPPPVFPPINPNPPSGNGSPTGIPTDTPTAGTTVTVGQEAYVDPYGGYSYGMSPAVKKGLIWGLGIAAIVGVVILIRR